MDQRRQQKHYVTALRIRGDEFIPSLLAYFDVINVAATVRQTANSQTSQLSFLPGEILDAIFAALHEILYQDKRKPWSRFSRCQARNTHLEHLPEQEPCCTTLDHLTINEATDLRKDYGIVQGSLLRPLTAANLSLSELGENRHYQNLARHRVELEIIGRKAEVG